uniref:Expressed conserved protein n=1 Tax=Macrostomum lignano TaxID=282301 RepID=A0A1I8FMR4_9PLAT
MENTSDDMQKVHQSSACPRSMKARRNSLESPSRARRVAGYTKKCSMHLKAKTRQETVQKEAAIEHGIRVERDRQHGMAVIRANAKAKIREGYHGDAKVNKFVLVPYGDPKVGRSDGDSCAISQLRELPHQRQLKRKCAQSGEAKQLRRVRALRNIPKR